MRGLDFKMSSNIDTVVEPKVESASGGPKLAETETKLATEPMHGEKLAANEGTQVEDKADTSSAAPVWQIFSFWIPEHTVWDFD